MNYMKIDTDNLVNGPGIRVVLWVSGCNHKCYKCHNPETWNPDNGSPFTDDSKKELFSLLKQDHISGITFSGGDPLYPGNRDEITKLSKEIRSEFPDLSQWLYTGYTYEEISDLDILNTLDVIIDGEFKIDLKDTKLKWRGSSNQRIIDVKETIKNGEIKLKEI